LDPVNPPQTGNVTPGGSEDVSLGTATAIGLTNFSGDAYIAAPGTNIAWDAELAAFDGGSTPPPLTPSGNESGQALTFDAAANGAAWALQTNDLGMLSGPLAPGASASLPLDADVMWIGITGLSNNDVYIPAPGISFPGYQAALCMLPGNTPTEHAARAMAHGGRS
jgi:hypothetical protein